MSNQVSPSDELQPPLQPANDAPLHDALAALPPEPSPPQPSNLIQQHPQIITIQQPQSLANQQPDTEDQMYQPGMQMYLPNTAMFQPMPPFLHDPGIYQQAPGAFQGNYQPPPGAFQGMPQLVPGSYQGMPQPVPGSYQGIPEPVPGSYQWMQPVPGAYLGMHPATIGMHPLPPPPQVSHAAIISSIKSSTGFSSPSESQIIPKLKRILPFNGTALKDSMIIGIDKLIELNRTLASFNPQHPMNFLHIIITDGADNCSTNQFTSVVTAIENQRNQLGSRCKTVIIGIDLDRIPVGRAQLKLIEAAFEDVSVYDINVVDLSNILDRIRLEINLVAEHISIEAQHPSGAMIEAQAAQVVASGRISRQKYAVLFNLDMSYSMLDSRWSKLVKSIEDFFIHLCEQDLVNAQLFNDRVCSIDEALEYCEKERMNSPGLTNKWNASLCGPWTGTKLQCLAICCLPGLGPACMQCAIKSTYSEWGGLDAYCIACTFGCFGLAYNRYAFRKKFGIEYSFVKDCLLHTFLCPFAIMQEFTEVSIRNKSLGQGWVMTLCHWFKDLRLCLAFLCAFELCFLMIPLYQGTNRRLYNHNKGCCSACLIGCIPVFGPAYNRCQLRKHYKLPGCYLQDLLLYCFYWPCALIQENFEVKVAITF